MKFTYQDKEEIKTIDLPIHEPTGKVLKVVRPLFEELYSLPQYANVIEEKASLEIASRPALLRAAKRMQDKKKGIEVDVTIPTDETDDDFVDEIEAISEIAGIYSTAKREARENLKTDEATINIALKILQAIVNSKQAETPLKELLQSDIETDFWQELPTREVFKTVNSFRVEAGIE